MVRPVHMGTGKIWRGIVEKQNTASGRAQQALRRHCYAVSTSSPDPGLKEECVVFRNMAGYGTPHTRDYVPRRKLTFQTYQIGSLTSETSQ